jgi:hypothetical protein
MIAADSRGDSAIKRPLSRKENSCKVGLWKGPQGDREVTSRAALGDAASIRVRLLSLLLMVLVYLVKDCGSGEALDTQPYVKSWPCSRITGWWLRAQQEPKEVLLCQVCTILPFSILVTDS